MEPQVVPYATDEDIALRASADFAMLCPRDQKVAAGSDGSFAGSDLWTLRSNSVNFAANGVIVGQVVQLLGPSSAFRAPGEALVVGSLSNGGLTLRRKGLASGVGQPPSPAGGLSGVSFLVATLAPQIAGASYDLDRRFGINDLIAGRRTSDLFDMNEVKDATVLTVLSRLYLDMSRENGGKLDTFAAKAQAARAELDDLLARVVLHWNPAVPGAAQPGPSSRFSARITR